MILLIDTTALKGTSRDQIGHRPVRSVGVGRDDVGASAHANETEAHQAAAFPSKGQRMRADLAASRKCARREAGMPLRRQLCTVDTGHWIMRATALVPPNPSMMRSASVCIVDNYDIRNFIASINCGIRNG
jgi:hypothetical protein